MSTGSVDIAGFTRWIGDFAGVIHTNATLLTDLDAAIGDADHGLNMDRGVAAVTAALAEAPPADLAAAAKKVGMTLVSSVGGASGPLYGTFFLRLATALGAVPDVDATTFAAALRAGVEGVVQRGKAEVGDKTMLDALVPAVAALDGALTDGADLGAALQTAADAAAAGRDATTALLARKGRASYLGERSVGHQDPGATSATMLIASAATAFA